LSCFPLRTRFLCHLYCFSTRPTVQFICATITTIPLKVLQVLRCSVSDPDIHGSVINSPPKSRPPIVKRIRILAFTNIDRTQTTNLNIKLCVFFLLRSGSPHISIPGSGSAPSNSPNSDPNCGSGSPATRRGSDALSHIFNMKNGNDNYVPLVRWRARWFLATAPLFSR
jgi:hypothetical protein